MHAVILAVCCLITGQVHGENEAPLSGVHVVLHGATTQTTTSDVHGNFSLNAPPGPYELDATAKGYASASIDLDLSHDSDVKVTLQAQDGPTLRTIASVTVDGRLTPSYSAIPSVTLTRADMARMGDSLAIQGLATLPGATFARPDGGGANAISVVALRGPDPSESLVALDGQLLNDGNTGDLDLSRIPLSALSSLNVTEGLGPEDANGSNTFGGAINFISLTPTQQPHAALQISGGSFGQSEQWINYTGAHDRLSYAFALDNSNAAGYVNQYEPVYAPCATAPCPSSETLLGSSVAAHMALANVTYSFSQSADINARVFLLGDNRDQSSSINGIDYTGDPQSNPTYGAFVGPGAQSFAQNVRAYQIRGQAPLGAGELSTDIYESDNSVGINGNVSNPAYDVTHIDHRYNLGMTWQRTFDTADFAIGGYTRYESLEFLAPSVPGVTLTPAEEEPVLGQTINVYFARGGFEPTTKLRLDAGVFESSYTSFGSNLDGRFAALYHTNPSTTLRFSLGTGFRAPLLIERYQFPVSQLGQDNLGVFVGQGNPNEHPEHATEYELGVSHQFQSATLDFSLYQTNLRDPIEIYYPFEAANSGACLTQTPSNVIPGCTSYNSNIGNAVYQGVEARFVQKFAPEHLFLTAMYGLNVAYPKDLTSDYSNPTSGANLVDYQQFPNIPQQQGSLELDWAKDPWHASIDAIFRGNNNELNQGPFTTFNAAVGFKLSSESDLTLAGTNLFNAATSRFTYFGAGVPYLGVGGQPIPTDRYGIEPFGVRFLYTVHTP